MATTTGQRIGIWIIAGALVIGTVGGFLAMMLAPKNAAKDSAYREQLLADYQADYAEYDKKKTEKTGKYTENADKYSKEHYPVFGPFEERVGTFEADSVTELKTEDLKQGSGTAVADDKAFVAYYVGWTPDGKIFDGSFDGDALKAPLVVEPGGVIEGWTKGVQGMKVGGIREITIPSDMAYGEQGSGDTIPPNTPLKFLVYVIDVVDLGVAPQPSEELMKLYAQQ